MKSDYDILNPLGTQTFRHLGARLHAKKTLPLEKTIWEMQKDWL